MGQALRVRLALCLFLTAGLAAACGNSQAVSSTRSVPPLTTTTVSFPGASATQLDSAFSLSLSDFPVGWSDFGASGQVGVSLFGLASCLAEGRPPYPAFSSSIFEAPGKASLVSETVVVWQSASQAKGAVASASAPRLSECLSSLDSTDNLLGYVLSEGSPTLQPVTELGSAAVEIERAVQVLTNTVGAQFLSPAGQNPYAPGFKANLGENYLVFSVDRAEVVLAVTYSLDNQAVPIDLVSLGEVLYGAGVKSLK